MVMRPPSSEPNASGISSWEGGVPSRLAMWKATGRRIASAPTFLMKVDMSVTASPRTNTCVRTDLKYGLSGRNASSATPERATAALTATMTTTSSLKPENAFSADTIPTITAADNASMATRS